VKPRFKGLHHLGGRLFQFINNILFHSVLEQKYVKLNGQGGMSVRGWISFLIPIRNNNSQIIKNEISTRNYKKKFDW